MTIGEEADEIGGPPGEELGSVVGQGTVSSCLERPYEANESTGGHQNMDNNMDVRYVQSSFGNDTGGRTSQARRRGRATAEEQKRQQNGIIVLDDSD